LVANELDDSRIKGGRLELDIEKAYDHVDLEFLVYIMRRMVFVDKWISGIYECSLTTFAVLVNGSRFLNIGSLRDRFPSL